MSPLSLLRARSVLRVRGLVLLLALAGVQLLTVGAALAGDFACGCDELRCVHRPGEQRVEATPAASCHHDAAAAAGTTSTAPDCTLRGCDHERDELLPFSAQASLPHPTAVSSADLMSAIALSITRPLLDRPSVVEPPPPRSSLV